MVYTNSKNAVFNPFEFETFDSLIMSLDMPEAAAFSLKDTSGFDKTHIIFENYNMGLLLSYIQEIGLGDIRLEFKNSFPVTILETNSPEPFSF